MSVSGSPELSRPAVHLETAALFAEAAHPDNPDPTALDILAEFPARRVTRAVADDTLLLNLAGIRYEGMRSRQQMHVAAVEEAARTVAAHNSDRDAAIYQETYGPIIRQYDNKLEEVNRGLAADQSRFAQAAPDIANFNALRDKRYDLGRGAIWRRWAAATAIGAALFAGYDLHLALQHEKFPSQTTQIIPGTERTVSVTAGQAGNPLAPNFQLTGTEVTADKRAILPILQKGDVIKAVTITATASDEAAGPNMGLGHADAGNAHTAKLRLTAAEEALETAVSADGLSLAGTKVTESSHEVILSPSQVKGVDTAATQTRMTPDELVKTYNTPGSKLPPSVRKLLDNLLGRNRSVSYQFTLEQEHTINTTRSQADVFGLKLDQRALWIIEGAGALVLGTFTTLNADGAVGRRARRRARKILAQSHDN